MNIALTHVLLATIIIQILSNMLKHSNTISSTETRGLSGGAIVLGKLPVPGRPTNLDYSIARAYCT